MHTLHLPRPENRQVPTGGTSCPLVGEAPNTRNSSPKALTTLTGLNGAAEAPDAGTPDLLRFSNDDCGNSQRLICVHGSDLVYSHPERTWLAWNGSRWLKDETNQSRALAECVMNEFIRQVRIALAKCAGEVAAARVDPGIGMLKDKRAALAQPNEKVRKLLFEMFDLVDTLRYAEKCLNRGPLTNMLAEAQRRLFVAPEQLDRDANLLNFLDATVDLRTGEARLQQRKDYITRQIAFPYNRGTETCPRFLAFLNWAMDGERDPERAEGMVAYLQMCVGYSFTGWSKEKAIFICFGTEGDNGKTLFLNLMRRIAADYGATIRVSSLMAKKDSNAVSSDMADLRGARYVMTSETEPGQKLSQSTVKFLTQGQGVTRARRMRENWMTFPETHSIWVDCNTLPAMPDNVEDPALRRLVPIEFRAQIPRDQIDRELGDDLYQKERSGIAAWIVQGAVRWFKAGQMLNHPPEIDIARDRWRRTDPFVRFLEDRCVVGAGHKTAARPAYQEFSRWWAESSLPGEAFTETLFGTRMGRRFPEGKHSERGWLYFGIGLRSEVK
jgi:putative DNA primase/helicase